MIPLRLELKNFLSYGESHPVLSLEGIHVACLSGSNGHGKSALLDAMVWALWGEPRGGARSGDDLIRHGANEMSVALDFEMDSARYRVTRKRVVRGKSGSSDLQFEGFDGESWRPLAEGSIGQTQDAINRLLRMSHDTFVHASFVQQGKADAFMTLTPQQRKQVLGDILSLGRYDELADAAREAGRDARSRADVLATQIRGIETELAKRQEYAERLAETTDLERQSRELVELVTAERTDLMREVERLVGVERLAAEKKNAQYTAQERATSLDRQLQDLGRRVAEADALTLRADDIERAFAEHQRLEEEEQAMASRFEEWCGTRDALNAAQAGIDRERIRIEAELASAERRVSEAGGRLNEAAGAQERARKLRGEIARLDELEKDLVRARKKLDEENGRLSKLLQRGEQLKQEPERVQQRIELLGKHQECPLCGQMLGTEGLAAAQARLQAELGEIDTQLQQTRVQYASQAGLVKTAQQQHKAIEDRLAGRAAIDRDLGGLTTLLQRSDQDRAALTEAQGIVVSLKKTLETGDYALEARALLTPLQERLAAIGYDPERHQAIRAERERLRDVPAQMRALDAARATMESAAPHRAGLETQLKEAQEEAAQLAKEGDELGTEAAALPSTRVALHAKEEQLQAASTAHRQAAQMVGEARQMVAWLDAKEKESVELVEQRDSLNLDVSAYTQLTDAFGKNGIQEMVIEQALPEIEEIANDLLTRLTDGRMRVALVTQRQGRAGATISTLDIVVRDELGSRPYELFSGGEKFRINFAVRIALSRLLARRANAPLQMLAIDEGFGSQDREGCDRLIEAIRAVQDDFEKVLVITHLEDLKDAFPVRIEVSKGPTGSTFAVA